MNDLLKSSGIIVGEDRRPRVICPKCTSKIVMDVKLFTKDVTKIVESNCPTCGSKLYTALLILVDSDLRGLSLAIQACIDAVAPGDKLLTS